MARGWISPGATARFSGRGGLREHVAHDDLRLGILEHEPGVPRELAGLCLRVSSPETHTRPRSAAVEVRHEAQRGAKERRLAASRLADEEHEPPSSTASSTSASAGRPAAT